MDFNTYKSRLLAQGATPDEVMINTTKQVIKNSFDSSLFSVSIEIDGDPIDVIINQGNTSEKKTLLFKPDVSIDKGSVAKIDDLYYLIMDFDTNKVYPIAKVELCNSTFPISSNKTSVLIGRHPVTGQPIYEEQGGETVNEPCIVESKYNSSNENDQMPIPDGRIVITMKYQVADNLRVNHEFPMYGNQYKIADIDLTKVVSNKGIMRIVAERLV